ncbi:AAA family ATPase [Ruminococcus sp.]|uniref:AAA family ATPase n=1 Tax=Ruminococcus sp. TaxID=41978 RepID=UPI0025E07580|nr:AAA family ATPase [Ruminococcus sp.]MBQ8965628.1 AAA family ATPase [Ruminococcus sp.]
MKGVFTNTAFNGYEVTPKQPTDADTKRYIFAVLKKRIEDWHNAGCDEQIHCVALSGVRRIGKTTVLKQLYNETSHSVYIEGGTFKGSLYKLITQAQQAGIRHIFIDEASKLDGESRGELIALVKNGTRGVFFVLTGSVAYLIDNISASICDCELLELPPILYTERLIWHKGISVNRINKALGITTNDSFIAWLRTGERVVQEKSDYIQGIVRDTLSSYSGNDFDDIKAIFGNRRLNKTEIQMLLSYVGCCQLLYILQSNQHYPNTPNITVTEYDEQTQQRVSRLKNSLDNLKKSLKREVISAFCSVLENARLAHRIFSYDETDNTELKKAISEYAVPAYVFEYPQFINDYFGVDVSNALIDNWVEYTILIKAMYYYDMAGKYRTGSGASEIDVVYSYSPIDLLNKGAIEVKNGAYPDRKAMRYTNTSLENIRELIISCNNVCYKDLSDTLPKSSSFEFVGRLRNDIIVVLLELGYIEKQYTQSESSVTLHELYEKYSNHTN